MEIDARTATPDWHGERLDLDWTIYVMRREARGRDGTRAGEDGDGRPDVRPDAA